MTTATEHTTTINGLNLETLQELVGEIKADHRRGLSRFGARTVWEHGMRSHSAITGWTLGGRRLPKRFTINIDEPRELLGDDAAPNPQEYLLAAMNACMLNTFIAVCALQGVKLESVEFESEGELDLRGFLGLDPDVKPGYDEIKYTIRVKGDGTEQQFQAAHDAVKATSPNYFNITQQIALNSTLEVL